MIIPAHVSLGVGSVGADSPPSSDPQPGTARSYWPYYAGGAAIFVLGWVLGLVWTRHEMKQLDRELADIQARRSAS